MRLWVSDEAIAFLLASLRLARLYIGTRAEMGEVWGLRNAALMCELRAGAGDRLARLVCILSSPGNRIVMGPQIININNLHIRSLVDSQSTWNLEFLTFARLESLTEFSQFKCLSISKKLKNQERPIQFVAENIVVFRVFMFSWTQKEPFLPQITFTRAEH